MAQNGTVSAGNRAEGPGGSVDYSIGQVIYMPASGNTGSISQGMQQPFVITAVTAISDSRFNLTYSTYPNPTSNFVILNITGEEIDLTGSSYSLFTTNGELIAGGEIENRQTLIPIKEFGSATYYLKIFVKKEEAKAFRIIKN